MTLAGVIFTMLILPIHAIECISTSSFFFIFLQRFIISIFTSLVSFSSRYLIFSVTIVSGNVSMLDFSDFFVGGV